MAITADPSSDPPSVLLDTSVTHIVQLLIEELDFAADGIRNLEHYAVFWDETEDVVRDQDKICMEAALLALLADRVGAAVAPAIDRPLSELTAILQPAVCSSWVARSIDQDPHSLDKLAVGYLVLREIAGDVPEMERVLARARATRQTRAREMPPFKEMERQWLLALRGAHDDRRLQAAAILSLAASDAHPIYMNRMDGYALSHAVFYLTDFGRRPLPGGDFAGLAEKIDAAIASALAARDYDLLIEFVTAAIMLGHTASAYLSFGLHFALRQKTMFGYLPGPSFSTARWQELAGQASEAYEFLHLYHPRFVIGLLCASLLGACPAGTPALLASRRTMPAPPEGGSVLAALAAVLARWQGHSTFAELLEFATIVPLDDRESAQVVADMAIWALTRAGALAVLTDVLQVIVDHGLEVTSTVQAAIVFLRNCEDQIG